jgi:hypothetical protein
MDITSTHKRPLLDSFRGPRSRAAAIPASWRSRRTSVSYSATEAIMPNINRPAGVDRSSESRRDTRFKIPGRYVIAEIQ